MALRPFGRHLHNQIVIPLLLASVSVALVATFVGVYRLSGIVDSWVEGNTRQAAAAARARLDDVATLLAVDARLLADDSELDGPLTAGDWGAAGLRLAMLRPNLGADSILVLDDAGRVIARAGTVDVAVGDAVPDSVRLRSGPSRSAFATFLHLGANATISGVTTAHYGDRPITMIVSRRMDEAFLRETIGGSANAYTISTAPGVVEARFVDSLVLGHPELRVPTTDYEGLKREVDAGNPALRGALEHPGTALAFSSGGEQYTVRAERVTFGDAAPTGSGFMRRTADPGSAARYLTVVMSNQVAADAGRTTVALIAFWSVLAVLVLTGLGTVIARNVSVPLRALADSARRVADGDFSSKVAITGNNEVAELADAFNGMTDSLHDRTEALTKKVLELATLYEMSRALGATLDLDVLLDSVLDSAMRIFNVDTGYVMLRDKNTGGLDLRSSRGVSPVRPDDGAVRSSMSDWVVRQGRPLIFNPPQE
jgi:HAMP domain-containing protein